KGPRGWAGRVAVAPDAKRIIVGGADGAVRVLDAWKSQAVVSLEEEGLVSSLAFSPDGKRIVTGGQAGRVTVWDARRGQEVLSLQGLGDQVDGVGFSRDGERISGKDARGKVLTWDADTGEILPKVKPAAMKEWGFGDRLTDPTGSVRASLEEGKVRLLLLG